MNINSISFECKCDDSKTYRLVFDGGQSGPYKVDLCNNCYKLEDKQFLLSEEIIGEHVSCMEETD